MITLKKFSYFHVNFIQKQSPRCSIKTIFKNTFFKKHLRPAGSVIFLTHFHPTYQKKAARVIFFADRLAHAQPLILDMNALNVYQINTYQNLILLYKAHTGTAPSEYSSDATLKEQEYLPLFKTKIKEMLSRMITSFRSFNDFKFNVLLLYYIILFSYVIISNRKRKPSD